MYRANQRTISLVNALLNVSRLELGTFMVDPKMINLIKLADNCLKDLKPLILKKNLEIITKYQYKNLMTLVDSNLLTIIIQNLLSNSIKYSKNGGKIYLSINKDQKSVLITVKDEGIGIPKYQQNDIYKKLFRADNAKINDPDGSGLGLYIIKEILIATGGKIWFESKENSGSVFHVSIPLSGMFSKKGNKTLV